MKCPRAKSANHCLTELFSIYQNKHWTIRRWGRSYRRPVVPPYYIKDWLNSSSAGCSHLYFVYLNVHCTSHFSSVPYHKEKKQKNWHFSHNSFKSRLKSLSIFWCCLRSITLCLKCRTFLKTLLAQPTYIHIFISNAYFGCNRK